MPDSTTTDLVVLCAKNSARTFAKESPVRQMPGTWALRAWDVDSKNVERLTGENVDDLANLYAVSMISELNRIRALASNR